MPRVVHFELTADNPERASKFYGDVFGWQFTKWEGPEDYWLITTGTGEQPGIDGGLGRRQDPSGAVTTNGIDVPSVDEYAAKIEESGGRIVVPKMHIPGVGYLAYCNDTEGNMFGIIEFQQ